MMNALPAQQKRVRHAAAAKRSRQRRAAHEPIRKRRTTAELERLAALPVHQRSAEEKEAVRNHRKQLKKQQLAVASTASALLPPPPPPTRTSTPSPVRASLPPPALPSSSLPHVAAPSPVRSDSLFLSTLDMEDIIGQPLSSSSLAPPPLLAAASTAHPSLSASLDLLASLSPSPPILAASAPSAAAALSSPTAIHAPSLLPSSTTAAASAMSSASKLRQAIMKKRSMSILQPNAKRREVVKGIKLGDGEEEEDKKEEVDEEEEKQWETVINNKIQAMIASNPPHGADVKRRFAYNEAHHLERITTNVRLWVSTARTMGCTGTEDGGLHAPGGCPGRFTPSFFFDLTHFAHWKKHKRSNNGKSLSADTVNSRARTGSVDTFRAFMTGATAHGRVLWNVCHKVETIAQSKRSTKKYFV